MLLDCRLTGCVRGHSPPFSRPSEQYSPRCGEPSPWWISSPASLSLPGLAHISLQQNSSQFCPWGRSSRGILPPERRNSVAGSQYQYYISLSTLPGRHFLNNSVASWVLQSCHWGLCFLPTLAETHLPGPSSNISFSLAQFLSSAYFSVQYSWLAGARLVKHSRGTQTLSVDGNGDVVERRGMNSPGWHTNTTLLNYIYLFQLGSSRFSPVR